MTSVPQSNRHIIIFDGVCNFCNGAVNFIINRDTKNLFVFAPMQSDTAKQLIEKYGADKVGTDTFLLIKNNKAFVRTNAALEICKDLSGYWYLFLAIKILPYFLRDFFYKIFARNRYFLFGKTDQCMMPADEIKDRFIDF